VEAYEEALGGITSMMAERIEEGGYGAFGVEDDEDGDGYYVVKWTSAPYTVQEDLELTQYESAASAGQ